MKYTEKKALYESIMKEVGRTVKKRLNESEDESISAEDKEFMRNAGYKEFMHYYNGSFHNKHLDSLLDIMKSKDSSRMGDLVARNLIEIWFDYLNYDKLRKGEDGAYFEAMLSAIEYLALTKDVNSMKEIVMKYHPAERNRH